MAQCPVVAVHAGAGARGPEFDERHEDYRSALLTTVERAKAVLEAGGNAVEAVQAAVMFMEDAVDFFNAGRGSTLCADGSVEMAAALMRGGDRAAGAVAAVTRARHPICAARTVLDHSPHVLLVGPAADAHAAGAGVEQRDPSYFVTERQRGGWTRRVLDVERGTVGAVCLDADGELAAATSTGGVRGQLPGRVGDTPLLGAGTWADEHVAVSCTGDGEAFIRAGAARMVGRPRRGRSPTGRRDRPRARRRRRARRPGRPDRRGPAGRGGDAVHRRRHAPRRLARRAGARCVGRLAESRVARR